MDGVMLLSCARDASARAYCANAALSYERVKPVTVGGRSVDEIREEIRREVH
jgi:hypothetical protein